MRTLREQPRLVAAKALLALVVLAAAVLIGIALAGDSPEPPPDLRPQLQRSEQIKRDQASDLARLEIRVDRLQADLRTATQRARTSARANQRLRRQLQTARRNAAAGQQP